MTSADSVFYADKVSASTSGKLKKHPVFVFDDFKTREHKFINTDKKERVYVLTLKNTGGFCRVLHVKSNKEAPSRILFETFSDIKADGTIQIQILADESTRIGIYEFALSLIFMDNARNIFSSNFTLQNSEFIITSPKCIRRKGFIPNLLRLLSKS